MSLPLTETDSVRLSLRLSPGQVVIEGAWWPRSLRLEDELPPLDRAVRDATGAGIARFAYTLGTWTDQPRKVHAASHLIKLGWFTSGRFPDSVDLSLDDYRRVVLVVVPPDAGAAESAAAMSAFDLDGTRSTSTEGTQPPPYHSPDLPSELAQQLLSTKETVRQAMLRVRGIADAGTRARAAAVLEVDLTLAATEARTVVDQAEPATDARA
ncbi:DUF5994 family protein [Phycicoccus sp. DTK01]|uniref:DUF5994 family protein n=1 Tax=Phycicoccus sp. DTK01 TaxID=2785745 RepID=UPI001A8F43E9|nr:DUF5994 family protein [Phycicoccus sp. DTK01]GIL35180.1 hypothetical protein PDTK01_12560 [Phycicoccus sp. DTK01]